MKTLILFCLLILNSTLAFAKVNSKIDPKIIVSRLVLEGRLQTLYPNISDYLDDQQKFGKFTKQDVSDIKAFLKSKKVSFDTKMKMPTVKNGKVFWEKLSLEVLDDGSLKTQNGRIVHFKPGMTAVTVLEKVFAALRNTDQASFFDVFVGSAYAGPNDPPDQFAPAGLAAASMYFMEGVMYPIFAITGVLCSATVLPVDWIRVHLRAAIFEGEVKCSEDGSSFDLTSYRRYSQMWSDEVKAFGKNKGNNPKLLKLGLPCLPLYSLIGVPYFAGGEYGIKDKDRNKIRMNEGRDSKFLTSVFGDKIPKCNVESAKKLEDYIRNQSIALQNELYQKQQTDALGNVTGPGADSQQNESSK